MGSRAISVSTGQLRGSRASASAASGVSGSVVWPWVYEMADHVAGIVFFFFQAEDGIRDYKVTGVQTCALPISALVVFYPGSTRQIVHEGREARFYLASRFLSQLCVGHVGENRRDRHDLFVREIGRAS